MTLEGNLRNGAILRAALALLLAAAALFALACASDFLLARGWAWRCPALALLNIPCPSCGSTRAFAALAEGQVLSALRFNPLIVLALPAAWLSYSFRDRLRSARWAWPLFFGLVLGNWIYLQFFLPR